MYCARSGRALILPIVEGRLADDGVKSHLRDAHAGVETDRVDRRDLERPLTEVSDVTEAGGRVNGDEESSDGTFSIQHRHILAGANALDRVHQIADAWT